MSPRLSSLTQLALVALVVLAWGRPWDAAFPPCRAEAAAPEAAAPAKKLEVTGAFFAYCNLDEDCSDSRILQIGRSPIQFLIDTTADKSLKGTTIDYTLELLTQDGKSVFDTGFSLELEYVPRQRARILYRKQPAGLANLAPGKYVYRAVAQTADGAHVSEWKRVVEARK